VPIYLTDGFETRKNGNLHQTRVGLVSFIAEITGETLSPLDAWAKFQTLPQLARDRFVRQAYMQELRESGIDEKVLDKNDRPRNGRWGRWRLPATGLSRWGRGYQPVCARRRHGEPLAHSDLCRRRRDHLVDKR
jgi:hypothetical protein